MKDWDWQDEQDFQDFMESWANEYLCQQDLDRDNEQG